MLNQEAVEKEEERLRLQIGKLTEENRKEFFFEVKRRVKDPDTYAVLNWFFIAGLHHFYLGKWLNGVIDLLAFLAGLALLVIGYPEAGLFLIILISVIELWALFRSQIIIQDWNNKVYQETLSGIDKRNHGNRQP